MGGLVAIERDLYVANAVHLMQFCLRGLVQANPVGDDLGRILDVQPLRESSKLSRGPPHDVLREEGLATEPADAELPKTPCHQLLLDAREDVLQVCVGESLRRMRLAAVVASELACGRGLNDLIENAVVRLDLLVLGKHDGELVLRVRDEN